MTGMFERDRAEAVAKALKEDVGSGDLTANLISPDAWMSAVMFSREPAILCGRGWAEEVFQQIGGQISLSWKAEEGDKLEPNCPFCQIQGPARDLLTAERTALNFLQMMSGVATTTRAYVDAIAGTEAVLLDTRKTLPGLRMAQKHATRCGGARNHRMGLYDAILIKENHISAAGSIAAAVEKARALSPNVKIEVEVETLEQLEQAIQAEAQWALLDNFTSEMTRQAVKTANKRILLEVSGNVSLNTIRAIALTGVDAISVGALTKHVQSIDMSMRVVD